MTSYKSESPQGRRHQLNCLRQVIPKTKQKMFKSILLLLAAFVAVAFAKPAVVAAPVAYTGLPVASSLAYTAPGFVTATSAQYVARNYNGLVAAPYVAAPAAAPLIASSAYSYAPAFVF